MKRFCGWLSLMLIATFLVSPVMVRAATYDYYIVIRVYNNSTTDYTTGIPVLVTIDNSQLASLGYINASGLDTDLLEGSTGRVYSVADARLGIFISSMVGSQRDAYEYRLGYPTDQSGFPVIVGVGGNVTVSDSATIELANNFTVEQDGWFDVTKVDSTLVYKENAFRTYVSGSGNITSSMDVGGNWTINVTATGLTSSDFRVLTSANVTHMAIYVDGVLKDITALGVNTTPDNGNTWVMMSENSTAYMDWGKISINSTEKLWFQPNTMIGTSNVPDRTGSGNTGTINWGTNPAGSGIEVTVGGIESSETYEAPSYEEDVPEVMGQPEGLQMFEDPDAAVSHLPLYPLVARASTSLGWTTQIGYSVLMLIFAIGFGFAGMVATGTIWGFVVGFGISAGAAGSTGVLPWWIAIVGVIFLLLAGYVWKYT